MSTLELRGGPDTLLTYDEVAARWKMSKRTVQRYVKSGLPTGHAKPKMIPVVLIGRMVRFRPVDIDDCEVLMYKVGILPVRRGPARTPKQDAA